MEQFLFTHSTFDLACLAAVRSTIVVVCLFYLERNIVRSQSIQRKQQKSSRQTAVFCLALMLLVVTATLIYALVKGVMVLVELLSGRWNNGIDPELRMSVPYIALSIVGIVFPAVDVVLSLVSWWCVKRMLRVKRIKLIINEPVCQDDEISDEMAAQNASLKRIFLLAKPVSYYCCIIGS